MSENKTVDSGTFGELQRRWSGQLNPAHSRWLMGLPPEWDDCAATAMPSSLPQATEFIKAVMTVFAAKEGE